LAKAPLKTNFPNALVSIFAVRVFVSISVAPVSW